jgi:hypothetical protein
MYRDFEEELLVSKNEEEDSRICGQVCHMSAGESEASTTGWRITISSDSRMEMEEYHYGFCIWVTEKQERT